MTDPGITQTKEVIRAAIAILGAAKAAGADGWSVSDSGLLIRDAALMDAVATALEGAQTIPNELGHLSFPETMELVMALMDAAKLLETKA